MDNHNFVILSVLWWHTYCYSELVTHITSGPIVALELMGQGAIDKWCQMVGSADPAQARSAEPLSIRARFGTGEYRLL